MLRVPHDREITCSILQVLSLLMVGETAFSLCISHQATGAVPTKVMYALQQCKACSGLAPKVVSRTRLGSGSALPVLSFFPLI